MVGRQRQVIGVAVLSLLIVLGIAALSSPGDDGERIVSDAGVLARAGLTTVVEPAAVVTDPTTTTIAPAPATTLGPPVTTKAPAPTTTAPRAAAMIVAAAPAPVAPAAVSTTTSTAAPATTTTTLDPCRNSTDPQCGPFRFDPQPGADNPMTVQVAIEPGSPVAGQPMVFHITLTDPDGVSTTGRTSTSGTRVSAGARRRRAPSSARGTRRPATRRRPPRP